MSSIDKIRFEELLDKAIEAAEAYYHTGEMLMSDDAYDQIIDEIQTLKSLNPEWDDRGVLSQVAAGTKAVSYATATHTTPMLSLQKLKTIEEVSSFESKVNSPLVFEVKLDGLAISATYNQGSLVRIATRGDGYVGEDITFKKDLISGLPKSISYTGEIEVRGEVYMSDSDFMDTNLSRVAAGSEAFLNARNATAGVIRTLELNYPAKLSFAAYDVILDSRNSLYTEALAFIEAQGFQTARSLIVIPNDILHASDILNYIEAARPKLGFPIDGVVIKVDSYKVREELGFVSHAPKWAAAYKYSADTKTTILKDIEVSTGRTGQMSLRAVLEPVFVAGTTITYATLHNPNFIKEADIRIGDTVYVYRAGDVIPRVDKVDKSKRRPEAKPWTPPTSCPKCGGSWNKENILWRCDNVACSFLNRLVYALGREALDIEGASDAIAEAMVSSGLVNSIPDIYLLTKEQLSELSLGDNRIVGEKVAQKIYQKIEDSRNLENYKFLVSLGLRTLGRTLSKRIMKDYPTLQDVVSLSKDQLSKIEGIGKEKAEIIYSEILNNNLEIKQYIELGLGINKPSSLGKDISEEKVLKDKVVVISGAIPGYTRLEAEAIVERLGGKASSSVSSKTNILISGEGSGSKYDKAIALGITIWKPEDFLKLI